MGKKSEERRRNGGTRNLIHIEEDIECVHQGVMGHFTQRFFNKSHIGIF